MLETVKYCREEKEQNKGGRQGRFIEKVLDDPDYKFCIS